MISRVPETRPERYKYGCSATGSTDVSISPRMRRATGGLLLAMKRMIEARFARADARQKTGSITPVDCCAFQLRQ
ncbi:MAG: hypothetical protein ACI8WM_003261 [Burkholderiaceae bacterium]|jgi:hypothetical protein